MEDVTTATMDSYDLQQYTISDTHTGRVAKLAKNIHELTKATLVGISKQKVEKSTGEKKWEVYPNLDDNIKLHSGDIVILLGNEDQFKRVRAYLGTVQGR